MGKAIGESILDISKRYSFLMSPTLVDFAIAKEKNDPLKFNQGIFKTKKGAVVTVDMLMYRDGIIADTRSSTMDSSDFIEDLLLWSTKQFGFANHKPLIRHQNFVSSLNIWSERDLTLINPKLKKLCEILNKNASSQAGSQFSLAAIALWPDPATTRNPIPFRFERAAGSESAENRYFSTAPVHTDVHLDMLKELEKLLVN